MTYLYYGENTQERDAAVKALLGSFIAVNGDMAVDVIDTEMAEPADVIDAVTTVPFLSPKRLVVLRYVSSNKELALAIETLLNRIADTTDVLFIESHLDARSVFAKTLKKQVNEVKHFESIEGPQLQGWVVQEAAKLGGTIAPRDAQLLLDRVGHNQQLIHNELVKLILVDTTISTDLIREMTHVTPSSSVFAMLDAIMQGNVGGASRMYYEQRAQGMEPQAILGMIIWQLHSLAITVVSRQLPADDIAKKTKLNPFVIRKNMTIAKKISKKQMVALLDAVIATDTTIKTGKAKADSAIHALFIELASIINPTQSAVS